MNNRNSRQNYLKTLYYNAGKSINHNTYEYMKHYINYFHLNRLFHTITDNGNNIDYYICDSYGAFFHTLCSRLSNEIFYRHTTITVIDPHYNGHISCQIYIAEQNISIVNCFSTASTCKVFKLYVGEFYKKTYQNHLISMDFFKKAYRQN